MSVRTVLLATVIVLASGAPIGAPATTSGVSGCEPIEGVEPLLELGRVVLVGELHGTQESPAFVGAVACHALAASRTVTIALEWPVQEAERVDAFLDSTGSDVDRDALLGGWIGAPGDQDGRRSEAMVALVETCGPCECAATTSMSRCSMTMSVSASVTNGWASTLSRPPIGIQTGS